MPEEKITFYDKDGNVVTYHDLQDKPHWCLEGEDKEKAFVRRYGNNIGYDINPQKKSNKYAPDLIALQTKLLTDLKSQHAPFFKAGEIYGTEPVYTVSFNVKDRRSYEQYYPDIDILYYVDWIAVKADIYGKWYEVPPFIGIYRAKFRDLLKVLDNAPVHKYKQRRGDPYGNAEDSYVFDIRNTVFEKLL